MAALPWLRIKTTARHNPKIQRLGALFQPWFNLLCLGGERDGYLPAMEDIAFELRLPEKRAVVVVSELVARKLVDETPDGRFRMHDWDEHQFKSDISTERVKRFRERQMKPFHAVSETDQRQSRTETETEQKVSLQKINGLISHAAASERTISSEEKRRRWAAKVTTWLYQHETADRADQIVEAWQRGEAWADEQFERVSKILHANKSKGAA